MKYIITESHFNHYLHIIAEQEEELDYYDDEDFIEIFFEYFRPWVKSTHGEDAGRYPMSYLLKKYYIEFCNYVGIENDDDEYWGTRQLTNIGRQFVIAKQHKLPTLRPSSKFTEKYSKQLDYVVKSLKLPEWLKINFTEENIYDVDVNFIVDYDMYLKTDGDITPYDYFEEFKKFLTDFMGVEEGNPSHGGLKLQDNVELVNRELFTNPKSTKLLKSKIKSLPNADRIRSIKIEYNPYRVSIQLSFDRGWRYDYTVRNDIRDEIYKMLEQEGYKRDKVRVAI
jgi:hypothetical protein